MPMRSSPEACQGGHGGLNAVPASQGLGRLCPPYKFIALYFRQCVPFDHWIELSARIRPFELKGGPPLSVRLLVTLASAIGPFSALSSSTLPFWVTV